MLGFPELYAVMLKPRHYHVIRFKALFSFVRYNLSWQPQEVLCVGIGVIYYAYPRLWNSIGDSLTYTLTHIFTYIITYLLYSMTLDYMCFV